jgi:hypothetical protein
MKKIATKSSKGKEWATNKKKFLILKSGHKLRILFKPVNSVEFTF